MCQWVLAIVTLALGVWPQLELIEGRRRFKPGTVPMAMLLVVSISLGLALQGFSEEKQARESQQLNAKLAKAVEQGDGLKTANAKLQASLDKAIFLLSQLPQQNELAQRDAKESLEKAIALLTDLPKKFAVSNEDSEADLKQAIGLLADLPTGSAKKNSAPEQSFVGPRDVRHYRFPNSTRLTLPSNQIVDKVLVAEFVGGEKVDLTCGMNCHWEFSGIVDGNEVWKIVADSGAAMSDVQAFGIASSDPIEFGDEKRSVDFIFNNEVLMVDIGSAAAGP